MDLRVQSDGILNSGRYWLSPKGAFPFIGYCDMDTEDGGWTLAYSYTFTNFQKFRGSDNTVTPIPTWRKSLKSMEPSVTISTKAPRGRSYSLPQYICTYFSATVQMSIEKVIYINTVDYIIILLMIIL